MKFSPPTRTVSLAAGLALASLLGLAVGKARARNAERRNPARGEMVGEKGSRLHYVQQGSGPDLVLIHGAAVTFEDMRPLIDALAGEYRVTAFDRPGHGYSDAAPHHASPVLQAERLRSAVQMLGLKQPVVLGHSLGGTVALAYGSAFPREIQGVVALAPLSYPGWGPGHLGPMLHALPLIGPLLSHTLFALTDPLLMRLAPRLMFAPQSPTQAFKAGVPMALVSRPVSMRADGAEMIEASKELMSHRRRYEAFGAPVQILVGERDKVLKPARQALRLSRDLPEAGLTVLPGVGHMLHHFEADAVRRAVAKVRQPARSQAPEVRPGLAKEAGSTGLAAA